MLTSDPSELLSSKRLEYLTDFSEISTIKNKTYKHMFHEIFGEIESNKDINTVFIKAILPLFCEEYLIALKRQVSKFYIGEDSVVYKANKSNPVQMSCVPTTALSAEHSVGTVRGNIRSAPSSNMSTHSNLQVIKSSPFLMKMISMDDETLENCRKENKNSEQVKYFLKLNKHDGARLKEERKEAYKKLVSAKEKILAKKRKLAEDVKNHGGPVQSPSDVVELVKRHNKLSRDELWKIIDLEIKYQKLVMNAHLVAENKLFLCSSLNKATRKQEKFSLEVRIDNLKSIVQPISDDDNFNLDIDIDSFVNKTKLLHQKMMKFPHREKPSSTTNTEMSTNFPENSTDMHKSHCFNDLGVADYIACFFSGYEHPWYIGIITRISNIAHCELCQINDFNNGLVDHCFEVRFLSDFTEDDKDTRSNLFVLKDSDTYHASPCQMLDCMPELSIEATEIKNYKLKYHIKNSKELLKSLNQNSLYIAMTQVDEQE